MCLVFEKVCNLIIEKDDDIDNVFIAAFKNRNVAENYIKKKFPDIIDDVIYKECIIIP